jgi:hypothetical protein
VMPAVVEPRCGSTAASLLRTRRSAIRPFLPKRALLAE